MKRILYQDLLRWKSSKRRKPFLLQKNVKLAKLGSYIALETESTVV